ncbi:hypothetical protein M5K25_023605 [Dendrobium thyrsiflorum]|uniref:Uncharacterized protein n=1 Tax=Dendrobium thyrsiflorum TaxID=117978 RepID=A0ABD0U966_DENTH
MLAVGLSFEIILRLRRVRGPIESSNVLRIMAEAWEARDVSWTTKFTMISLASTLDAKKKFKKSRVTLMKLQRKHVNFFRPLRIYENIYEKMMKERESLDDPNFNSGSFQVDFASRFVPDQDNFLMTSDVILIPVLKINTGKIEKEETTKNNEEALCGKTKQEEMVKNKEEALCSISHFYIKCIVQYIYIINKINLVVLGLETFSLFWVFHFKMLIYLQTPLLFIFVQEFCIIQRYKKFNTRRNYIRNKTYSRYKDYKNMIVFFIFKCNDNPMKYILVEQNLWVLTSEAPSGTVALTALSFHSIAFFLISFPFCSPAIISLMSFSTSFLFTLLSISNPTPHSTHAYLQLVCCSAKNGQQIIGTPKLILSIVEFQPECVRKTPTVGCMSTSSCAHQLTISPLSLVSSINSGGNTEDSPLTRSGRITHKKWYPLLAKPHANSKSCSLVITVMLPKLTYTIEQGS